MTECELIKKLEDKSRAISFYITDFNECARFRNEVFSKQNVTMQVNKLQIRVPDDITYMCSAIVFIKQDKTLDDLAKACAEVIELIEQYKKEQEEKECGDEDCDGA